MESKTNNGNTKGSDASAKSSNRRSNNNRKSNKDKKASAPTARSRKKPNFIGASHEKIKAVVADEPGLDPLSTQLEKLEKEVYSYAFTSMNAHVAKAIKNMTPFNFDTSPLFPIPVNPAKYTTYDNSSPPVATEDPGMKNLLNSILNSEIRSFVMAKETYRTYMEQVYGMIEANIDEKVKSLVMSDPTYDIVAASNDPIALIKLLRKMCRKEKGVDYAIGTFHSCLSDLLTSKQGADTNIVFMETIKLKYDVVTSQFGNDWIPSSLKDDVMSMDNGSYSNTSYDTCTASERATIDTITTDRLLAYIGVNGFARKLSGGLTLKAHINNSAAINNNASVCYPSDIAALLKLVTSIIDTTPKQRNTPRSERKDDKRDGAQFAQTGTPSAAQLLMTGYADHDDDDLYGHPHFIQTGRLWYGDVSGDVPADSDSSTGSMPPPLITRTNFDDSSSSSGDSNSSNGEDYMSDDDDESAISSVQVQWEVPPPDDAVIADDDDASSIASSFHNWTELEDSDDDDYDAIDAHTANYSNIATVDVSAAYLQKSCLRDR